jgi:glycosyltransferase involved in cell wall biosynthesis
LKQNIGDQNQRLRDEILTIEQSSSRVVMTCITEGRDMRALKEAVTLRKAGYQLIMLHRSVSGHKPLEHEDGVMLMTIPAIHGGKDLIKALRNRRVKPTFRPLERIGLWVLALLAYLLGYSFTAVRITRPYPSFLLRLVNLPVRYIVRPWHVLWVFRLYQCEFTDALLRLNPDIIHAHDLYMLRLSLAAARATGARCIYDAHELESERRHGTRGFIGRAIIKEEKALAHKADAVITVSPMIADRMAADLAVRTPVLILNAPETGTASPTTIRRQLGLKPSIPLVVFVGKVYEIFIHDHKTGLLIEAIGTLPQVHLAFIGPMSDKARKQAEDLAHEWRCEERIHFVKPLPANQLVAFLKDADVGAIVMPPHTENTNLALPNKLFESLLAGLVVVSFNNRQIRAILEPVGRGVFVENIDRAELAEGISAALVLKKELMKQPACDEEIMRNYSWEAQATRLCTLYDNLIPAPGVP